MSKKAFACKNSKCFRKNECNEMKNFNFKIKKGKTLTSKQILCLSFIVISNVSTNLSLIITDSSMTTRLGNDPNFIPIFNRIIFHLTDFYSNFCLILSGSNKNYTKLLNSYLHGSIQANLLDKLAQKIINSKLSNLTSSQLSTTQIVTAVVVIVLLLFIAGALYYADFATVPERATGKVTQTIEINGGSNASEVEELIDSGQYEYDPASWFGVDKGTYAGSFI
jgi:hypothetical protein